MLSFVAREPLALAEPSAPPPASERAAEPTPAADPSAPRPSSAKPSIPPQPPAKAEPHGVVVVNASANPDDALALARALDASAIRPSTLDAAHARVLAGMPAPDDAPADVRELAEIRGALDREDAAARRLLASLTSQFGAAGVVVLHAPASSAQAVAAPASPSQAASSAQAERERPPTARLFLAATGDFDAARYEPDPSRAGTEAWRAVVISLERTFAAPAQEPARPRLSGNALAVRAVAEPKPREHEESKPFYASGWFWGAIGGAALLGTGIYFASQGSNSDTVQLRMQVPR